MPPPSAAGRSRCHRTTHLLSLFGSLIWPEIVPLSSQSLLQRQCTCRSSHSRVSVPAMSPAMAPRLTAIHLSVLVNGKPVRALLDTGAMLSVCSKDVATRCGLVESRTSSRLQQGVLGPPMPCTFAMATVSLGRATTTLSMGVVDNPDASFNMLLGADWCEHFAVEISFRTRSVLLDLGDGEAIRVPFGDAAARKTVRLKLSAAKDQQRPASCQPRPTSSIAAESKAATPAHCASGATAQAMRPLESSPSFSPWLQLPPFPQTSQSTASTPPWPAQPDTITFHPAPPPSPAPGLVPLASTPRTAMPPVMGGVRPVKASSRSDRRLLLNMRTGEVAFTRQPALPHHVPLAVCVGCATMACRTTD